MFYGWQGEIVFNLTSYCCIWFNSEKWFSSVASSWSMGFYEERKKKLPKDKSHITFLKMWNDIWEGSVINTYANYDFYYDTIKNRLHAGCTQIFSARLYHSRKLFKWCLFRAFNQYLCMCLEIGGKGV